jgi:nanoRNase/pAp phosphatase (c-di-AMP/oligoRNAs hydrolase)
MEGWDLCFLLYPLKNGQIKASMRSSHVDVSKICMKFWWWGHKLAAGFSSDADMNTIAQKILKEI